MNGRDEDVFKQPDGHAARRAARDSDGPVYDELDGPVLRPEPVGLSGLWRRRIAQGLVWVGRAVMGAWPLGFVVTRLTSGIWMSASSEDGLPVHPITDVMMGLSFIFAMGVPVFLLPVASGVWLYPRGDGTVRVPTVLGTRVLEADSVSTRPLFELPGRGWGITVTLVRDRTSRWFLMADSGLWHDEEGSIVLGMLAILAWSAVTVLVWAVLIELTFLGTPSH